MAQLLLEFLSEEIPARMQKRAEEDLARLTLEKLAQAGFIPDATKTFSTPRRVAIVVDGLPFSTPDVREERKGPRVGAPDGALQGFLRGAGLASIDQAHVKHDPKGDFYVAVVEKPGRETHAVIGEIVPQIMRTFPWPKSMRSGSSDLTWVRPLKNILCTFDGEGVAIRIDHVPSRAETCGHRFHAPAPISVRRFEDYSASLSAAHVMLDREDRKRVILRDAKTLCEARNLELVEDGGLLEEVAGLVEWPVPIMGDMDPAFLDLPSEVIRLTMRTHQKYFAVRNPKTKALAPNFITVANVEASDGGRAIALGNARVLSARLNDARYFWDVDRFYDPIEKRKPKSLYNEERRRKLEGIVFHQKLGSVWDKVERVGALARELAPIVGADVALVGEAVRLCKMDLATELVGEFPELQGYVGRELYLAEESREGERAHSSTSKQQRASDAITASPKGGEKTGPVRRSVAVAIEDHYRPLGPNDRVPADPVSITAALADKLDTLSAFWSINEKPTGSSDPYSLRRTALGFVRIVLANNLRIEVNRMLRRADLILAERDRGTPGHSAGTDVLAFLADRLKVQLREQGKRHDLVDAVFALGDDDLVRIVMRVEALSQFLATESGEHLLAGYKRAANILRAEERKDDELSTLLQSGELEKKLNADLFCEPEERALREALEKAASGAREAVEKEDFSGAMAALSKLRAPVDRFFDAVLVNDPDPSLRLNRLALLSRIRAALHEVADFSKIEG